MEQRDHGGGIDAAITKYGGHRTDWIDLSTGINPIPYPYTDMSAQAWTALPDSGAQAALLDAARRFWRVDPGFDIVAAPGASALIARIPWLWPEHRGQGRVRIDAPTYNEHAAAFRFAGWDVTPTDPMVRVVVHPNNPTGDLWSGAEPAETTIIDESFCDVFPDRSFASDYRSDCIILKSFGKFWGLAGVRLGFAIGPVALISHLKEALGPWAVSGPALELGTHALLDTAWADETRTRLRKDADRLDAMATANGLASLGGTTLFRLYEAGQAAVIQDRLARHHIWSRIFPYSDGWVRLGLPAPAAWDRLGAALTC